MNADLIVIGAGPAGMAAARLGADRGLSVVVLDEQMRGGGQIYRDVETSSPLRGHVLGKDYSEGLLLTSGLVHSAIDHIHDATVWAIEDGTQVSYTSNGRGAVARGKRILICTGAIERPMPLPGWTLPGVMTAGAGQILLKGSGLLATQAVLVGSGPLLYLIGAQMVRGGTPPLALVETQGTGDLLAALRHSGGAVRGWRYLAKGLGLLNVLRRAGVARYKAATEISIDGQDCAEAVRFTSNGQLHRVPCETVLLHHGVVPNSQVARSIDIVHDWDTNQHCFVPRRDEWGRTDIATVFIAGDGAGIAGAKAAAHAGQIAALEVVRDLGRISVGDRDKAARPVRRLLSRELAARPFIDRAYPPYKGASDPLDTTIVCRCEEVTAGDVRRYAALGCRGPNQTKAFGRCGMGPCQGRYCGLAVTELLAKVNKLSPDTVGYYRIRAPIKPITLQELADMDHLEESEDAL